MTYRDALIQAAEILKRNEVNDAELDAWYLLEEITGLTRVRFVLCEMDLIPEYDYTAYCDLVRKRAAHIPLQYLTGKQEFMGLSFTVSEAVLIPRQDTEILVEEAMKVCQGKVVLDMCTGSGCIIISLARLTKLQGAYGVDISKEALKIAEFNAAQNKVCIHLIQSDMFKTISGYYDIIVSNPPYIPSSEIKNLMHEVQDYEPRLALDGKEDGLEFYRVLAKETPHYLTAGGWLILEIGSAQAMEVRQLLIESGFGEITIKKDYAGLDRVILAQYCENTKDTGRGE